MRSVVDDISCDSSHILVYFQWTEIHALLAGGDINTIFSSRISGNGWRRGEYQSLNLDGIQMNLKTQCLIITTVFSTLDIMVNTSGMTLIVTLRIITIVIIHKYSLYTGYNLEYLHWGEDIDASLSIWYYLYRWIGRYPIFPFVWLFNKIAFLKSQMYYSQGLESEGVYELKCYIASAISRWEQVRYC